MNNKEIVKEWWFNTLKGTIGILEVKDILSHDIDFYVGIVNGNSVEEDIKSILDYGANFHPIDLL